MTIRKTTTPTATATATTNVPSKQGAKRLVYAAAVVNWVISNQTRGVQIMWRRTRPSKNSRIQTPIHISKIMNNMIETYVLILYYLYVIVFIGWLRYSTRALYVPEAIPGTENSIGDRYTQSLTNCSPKQMSIATTASDTICRRE